jgi:hypothetical protein
VAYLFTVAGGLCIYSFWWIFTVLGAYVLQLLVAYILTVVDSLNIQSCVWLIFIFTVFGGYIVFAFNV